MNKQLRIIAVIIVYALVATGASGVYISLFANGSLLANISLHQLTKGCEQLQKATQNIIALKTGEEKPIAITSDDLAKQWEAEGDDAWRKFTEAIATFLEKHGYVDDITEGTLQLTQFKESMQEGRRLQKELLSSNNINFFRKFCFHLNKTVPLVLSREFESIDSDDILRDQNIIKSILLSMPPINLSMNIRGIQAEDGRLNTNEMFNFDPFGEDDAWYSIKNIEQPSTFKNAQITYLHEDDYSEIVRLRNSIKREIDSALQNPLGYNKSRACIKIKNSIGYQDCMSIQTSKNYLIDKFRDDKTLIDAYNILVKDFATIRAKIKEFLISKKK